MKDFRKWQNVNKSVTRGNEFYFEGHLIESCDNGARFLRQGKPCVRHVRLLLLILTVPCMVGKRLEQRLV